MVAAILLGLLVVSCFVGPFVFVVLRGIRNKKVCPDCGTKLEYLGEVPYISPGGIYYYKCPKCPKYYYDDQRETISHQAGLKEVSETHVETTVLV